MPHTVRSIINERPREILCSGEDHFIAGHASHCMCGVIAVKWEQVGPGLFNLEARVAPEIPPGECHIIQDGKVVGKIVNLGDA